MQWNEHSKLKGQHAFLSASKYHWINYDPEKLQEVYLKHEAIERGTKLHEFAANAINLGIKLKSLKKTLNLYVNDAIGFKMRPEQVLYFSENCFGTADAISFKRNFLRIHDLKTGETPASIHQLEIYAALFCLEYDIRPGDIEMELRIYQSDQVFIDNPTAQTIVPIMDKIVSFDRMIEKMKENYIL